MINENTIAGPSTVTTAPLPVALTIDAVNDLIPIYTANVNATQAISRNGYLGILGSPVGNTDTQTLSNKTLGNTNVLTIKDANLTLQNTSDITKQAKFSLASITTGQTRTYVLPDLSDTFVTLTATQTLTNKTLTSPVINSPSITNATITSDSYAGFTTSNSGSIYGISVASAVITQANSIGTGTIVQNGVAASQLATTAIKLGSAQITSNFVGSGTAVAQVTGLTVTVTNPAGGRSVEIMVYTTSLSSSSSGTPTLSLWNGTVGSGTQLEQSNGSSSGLFSVIYFTHTPAAGSITYNVGAATSAGVPTVTGGATFPAFIVVKAI